MSNFVSNDNAASLFTKLSQSLGKRPKTWTGTRAAWDQMTTEQKAVYDGWYVNFTDDAEEGGGGAGGGHIIEDSEGTELTQRDTLKVGGSLIAEDDSTNEKTIITDGMEEIDYEDWIALTPQEQAAIPKALITNVPGLGSKMKVECLKKLWENPEPTMAFAAQTISLSSGDYDFLLIQMKRIKTESTFYSTVVEKGRTAVLGCPFATAGGATNTYRIFSYVSDTSLSVGTGYKATGTTSAVADSDCAIPVSIYGFKSTLDIDITAYMADLETDASNVNLSDGRTVEEAIAQGVPNNIETSVSLTLNTPYVTPSMGYFTLHSSNASNTVIGRITGADGNNYINFSVGSGQHLTVFVPAGVTIAWVSTIGDGGAADFHGLY